VEAESLPPLSWAELAALASTFPPPGPQKTLHVSHLAEEALYRISVPAQPPGMPGMIPGFLGVPVIPDPELPPGAWEIRAGDKVISSGVIR
jgi:hypothetical protein